MKRLSCILLALASAPAAIAQCSVYDPDGTAQGLNGTLFDGWTAATPLGFAFPFEGGTFTDVYISDHGLISLNTAGVPAAPAAGAFVYNPDSASLVTAGSNLIAPYWSDHTLTGGIVHPDGDIWVDNSSGTQCTITWFDVKTYNTTGVGPTMGQIFSVSCTLFDNGNIEFSYDNRVNNDGSSFAGTTPLTAVVGIGVDGDVVGASIDVTTVGAVAGTSTFHETFVTTASGTPNPLFDLGSSALLLIPTSPGWAIAPLTPDCATVETYGVGCGDASAVIYEDFPAATNDLPAGYTVTLLRGATDYTALDAIPGAIIPHTGAAVNVAAGLFDGEEAVTLSAAMPIPGGTTTSLMVATKGYITLTGLSNGAIDWTPTPADLLAWPEPTVVGWWSDYNQTAAGSGLILFEEIGGIALVTWDGVNAFGNLNTFQIQFELATGNITIVLGTLDNTVANQMLAYKASGVLGVDPGPSDLNVDLAATQVISDAEVGPLTLNADRPVLGEDWDFVITNIDPLSPIAVTFFSDAGPAPGILPLEFLGMPGDAPGCDINIANIVADATSLNFGGSSTFPLPLPPTPALSGAALQAQSICLTTRNNFNLFTSNGVNGVLGSD